MTCVKYMLKGPTYTCLRDPAMLLYGFGIDQCMEHLNSPGPPPSRGKPVYKTPYGNLWTSFPDSRVGDPQPNGWIKWGNQSSLICQLMQKDKGSCTELIIQTQLFFSTRETTGPANGSEHGCCAVLVVQPAPSNSHSQTIA